MDLSKSSHRFCTFPNRRLSREPRFQAPKMTCPQIHHEIKLLPVALDTFVRRPNNLVKLFRNDLADICVRSI